MSALLERKSIQVDGVYDIETSNWTDFVVGAVLDRTGFYPYTWRREGELFDALISRKGRYFAHNGGRYDALWFLNHVRSAKLRAICNGQGQRLTNVKVGGLILCDSYALVPMPLKKGAALGKVLKKETSLPCVCGSTCGGYCSITRTMPVSHLRQLIEYLEYDCLATLSMLDSLTEFAETNDLDLQYTIGGSSWATARRLLDIPSADWSWGARRQSASTLYSFARQAYFGGRTQVFRPRADYGWRYDINSAYPAALASLRLPSGCHKELFNGAARKAYRDGLEGLYRANVYVPECHIPPLPVRGQLRLQYPFGNISGIYAGNELRYAEEMGCRILRVDACLAWSSSEVVFGPLLNRLWDLRDKAGKKSPYGTWLKWFANSLTGRLAIRPEGETIFVGEQKGSIRACPADWDCRGGLGHGSQTGCCFHRCTKRCGATLPLAEWGQSFGVYVRPRWQIADSAHIHYAAYLTAHARITLHRQLVGDGASGYSTVYCDTDSCICIVERIDNIGKGLGQFDNEGEFGGWNCLAPKTYDYFDQHGEVHSASKGVEDAQRNFGLLARGESVNMSRGVKSLRSAIKDDNFFVRKSLSRSVLGTTDINDVRWYGDRWLGPDGVTHPLKQGD